jgi:hypothetical protein
LVIAAFVATVRLPSTRLYGEAAVTYGLNEVSTT